MAPQNVDEEKGSRAPAGSEGHLLLLVHFAQLKDPRRHQHKVDYPLPLLLLIVFGAVLSGFKCWEEFADFAQEKRQWLKHLVPYEADSTPCADTIERVFERLEASTFKACLEKWAGALAEQLRTQAEGSEEQPPGHLAMDGKSLAGSHLPGEPTSPLHLLHVYLVQQRLLLAMQRAHKGAPGEPAAALELLSVLEVRDALITADANLMTKAVADSIVEREGHYLLALKGNRGPQHDEVRERINQRLGEVGQRAPEAAPPAHSEQEHGHGRDDQRQAWAFTAHDFPVLMRYLPHAQSVLCLERLRQPTGGKTRRVERTFYVSDLPPDAPTLAARVRAHWEVENQLHRTLDVLLHEDSVQVRPGPAALNLAVVRRFAEVVLRRDTLRKGSMASKMRHAVLNDSYRTHLLTLEIS
jgi:predicted transposase YbfD/YdcC